MIVFDLQCSNFGHRFEGWFGSSDDFVQQQARGLIACPACGGAEIIKAPMAANLGRKGNQVSPDTSHNAPAKSEAVINTPLPPEAVKALQALAEIQAKALEKSRWVGGSFAEVSREIHYGEREAEAVHGQATMQEAKELIEEGIEIAPLPFPFGVPGKAN